MSTTLILDQFTAADGTAVAGRTPSPTNTPGNTWSATVSNLNTSPAVTIQGNAAGVVAGGSLSVGYTVIDSGVASQCTITVDVTTVNATVYGGQGVVFRQQDASNYWYADLVTGNNNLRICEVNSGAETFRASASVTINANTTYACRLMLLSDNSITWTVSGVSATYTSSSMAAQTRQGLIFVNTGTAASGADNYRFNSGIDVYTRSLIMSQAVQRSAAF